MSTDPLRWVEKRTPVRVYSLQHRPGMNDVLAEGRVIGYNDRPTIIVEHADGRRSSWGTDLPIEELPDPLGDLFGLFDRFLQPHDAATR